MTATLSSMVVSARVLAAESTAAAALVVRALDLAETAATDLARSAGAAVAAIDVADAACANGYAPHYIASTNDEANAKVDKTRSDLDAMVQLARDAVACASLVETRAASVTAAMNDIANRARLVQETTGAAARAPAAESMPPITSANRTMTVAKAKTAVFGGVHKGRTRTTETRRLQDDMYSVLERDDTLRARMAGGDGGRWLRRQRSARNL